MLKAALNVTNINVLSLYAYFLGRLNVLNLQCDSFNSHHLKC